VPQALEIQLRFVDGSATFSMKHFSTTNSLIPLLALGLLALLTWPVWRWLWSEWMGNDYYSHGVLIPVVTLYLILQRLRNDPAIHWWARTNHNGGLVLVAVGLALFLYFFNGRAYYLAAFAMIGLIGGLVWAFVGGGIARKLIFPLGYLVLMVPLPFLDAATMPLALFTGVCSGALVRFFGLDVSIVGNAVTLPNADLVIGAQCSGVNSIIALTSILVLAAYLLDGPLWGRLLLVLMAIPLAMLGNILRVASLLVVARNYGAQSAFTFYHDYSGILFFVAVLLLLFPLTRLLQTRGFRLEVI
jgi:exosortase